MEQSSGKKERLMLAAGVALALAAAAWQYLSPASGEIMAGRDINLALLGEKSSILLVYHPFSRTVNAFTSTRRARRGASAPQHAAELASAASGRETGKDVFYIQLSSSPELSTLWAVLNGWRADPRLLAGAVSWVCALRTSGATNLKGFDLFSLFSEFSVLGASDFILTDVQRRGGAPEPEEGGVMRAPLVEVFNASGRSGLAALAAKHLRAKGFDVITVGNRSLQESTSILGFSSDTSAALALRAALGLEELEIRVRPAQKSVAGAAVVLGEDFNAGTLER
jgi:hypothetical protein